MFLARSLLTPGLHKETFLLSTIQELCRYEEVLFSGTALLLVLGTGSASSADLYYKAPPAVPPPLWTGFYIGGNAGGISQSNSVNTVADPLSGNLDTTYFVNNAGVPNGPYWASNSALGATGNSWHQK